MNKITPFLTFPDRAEEAIRYYVSTFKNSKIVNVSRYETDEPVGKGKVVNASFVLDGQEFMAMDGGPYFSFAQGHSLFVNCDTQEEIDRYTKRLVDGGEQQPCGWVKDRFGVSWQIIPKTLGNMMERGTSEQRERVFAAMMKMTKMDIKALERAYRGS